jgi:hypothetical protein
VSPEDYQAIAAGVASMPTVDWQEIHNDPLGVSEDLEDVVAAALRDRIQDAIASREISDQKIAAMHAVLRAIGAEFAWVRRRRDLAHHRRWTLRLVSIGLRSRTTVADRLPAAVKGAPSL